MDGNGYPLQLYALFGYENDGAESGIEQKDDVPKVCVNLVAKRRIGSRRPNLSEAKEGLRWFGVEGLDV